MLGHSETYCRLRSSGDGADQRGWSLDLRALVRRAVRMSGERWLNKEGLGSDGAETVLETPRSYVVHENSVNSGGNIATPHDLNLRGKVLMEIDEKRPQSMGLSIGSTLRINDGSSSDQGEVIGLVGPEEKKEAFGLG